jgi:hypothetical protein
MPATSAGRLRQSVQEVSHAISVGMKVKSAYMEMVREIRRKSETSNPLRFYARTNNFCAGRWKGFSVGIKKLNRKLINLSMCS